MDKWPESVVKLAGAWKDFPTVKEAKFSAAVRTELEKTGTPIDPLDILIGGTALSHQSILVTHNTKEFGRINRLRIEDWY